MDYVFLFQASRDPTFSIFRLEFKALLLELEPIQLRPVDLQELPYLHVFMAVVIILVGVIVSRWAINNWGQLDLGRKTHPILPILFPSTLMESWHKDSF